MDERAFLKEALSRLGLWQGGDAAALRGAGGRGFLGYLARRLPDGPICIKRALAKLRVEMDWRAPVERNAYEVAWMETAREIEPDAAPEILARDTAAGLFAMPYLDPATHFLWKEELRQGRADPAVAAEVGRQDRPYPLGDGGQGRNRGGLPDRRNIPRDPAGTLSGGDGGAPSGSARILFGLSRRTAGEKRAWCMAMSARRTF